MKQIISILLCLLLSLSSSGQTSNSTSEQQLISLAQTAVSYRYSNLDSCLHFYEQIIEQADREKNYRWSIIARMQAAQLFLRQAKHEEGLPYAYEAYSVSTIHQIPPVLKDTTTNEVINIYTYLGTNLREGKMNQPDSAFYYLALAEQANLKYDNPVGNWSVYRQIGTLYNDLGELDKAETYYLKAYRVLNELAPTKTPYMTYILAEFYFDNNRLKEYSEYAEQFIAYMDTMHGGTEADNYHAGFFTITPQNEAVTLQKLNQSITFHRQMNNSTVLARTYAVLGNYYFKKKDYQQARMAFEDGLSVATANAFTYLRRTFEQKLYETNKALGNFQTALAHHEAFQQLADSLRSQEAERRLVELEVQYETEKKEQQIQIQQLEIVQKTQQRNFLMGSSALFFLLGGTVVLGFRNRMQTSKKLAAQESALQTNRIRELEQEKQLLSYSAMLEGQETERKRIAQDLHDSLGGLLTTVKAHVGLLDGNNKRDNSSELYEQANRLIDDACLEVRRISHDMMPRVLELFGLKGALEDLAVTIQNQGVDCHLELLNIPDNLQETQALMIYRTVQELVQNSQKHAAAQSLLIQLIGHENALHILVEDDGKGFDVQQAVQKEGLGLQGIQSRVAYLRGEVEFDSVAEEGTTVTIQIPL